MVRYIYPPRPKSKIKPDQLAFLDAKDQYLWQPKFDGDRCVAVINDGETFLGNRYGKWHSAREFSQIRSELLELKVPDGCHYLDGELITHENQPVLVLFDVLQWKQYLTGKTQTERLEILDALGGEVDDILPVNRVTDHLWISHWGQSEFCNRFRSFIEIPLLEGLMLRKRGSTLTNWGASKYEVDWQIRCRKPSKTYRF